MTGKNLIDLSDVAGLSEPLTKLIETVGNAAGTLYEPTKIRKKAKAEADAIIISTKAESEKTDIEIRMQDRVVNHELRRQKNIESITHAAAESLSEIDEVSKESVDEDWVYRFFEESQDISDAQMQSLWAKILAEEVKKPKSFSIRTLRILKDLTKKDAENFTILCSFVWGIHDVGSSTYAPIIHNIDSEIFIKNGLHFGVLQELDALGLIHFSPIGGFFISNNATIKASYCGKLYILNRKNKTGLNIGKVTFTNTGLQLFKIAEAPGNKTIGKTVVDNWKTEGWEVTKVPDKLK